MGGAVKDVFGGINKLGGKVLKIADPLGIDPSGAINKGIGKILGGGDGDGLSMAKLVAQAAGEFAAQPAPADPNLKPFNRPAPTPDLSEGALRDRRRSLTSAIRRRKAASILTGEPSGTDSLGT